jgi:DNA-binding transcriptional ArsR family regulator
MVMDLVGAIAGRHTRVMLAAMRERGRYVTELAELTGLDRRNVSKYVGRMRRDGLVEGIVDGRRHLYRIAPAKRTAVDAWLDWLKLAEEAKRRAAG